MLRNGDRFLPVLKTEINTGSYCESGDCTTNKEFKWSDYLTLSAQKYIDRLKCCDVYAKTLVHDESMHDDIDMIAEYDDHFRMVVYPESLPWGDAMQTVMAWGLDDSEKRARNFRYLLSQRFTHLGIACDYHSVFGQYCVIEVGRNVRRGAKYELPYMPEITELR